jgi:hypothetical protein
MKVLEARGTKRNINGVETTQDDAASAITDATRQRIPNDSASTPSSQGAGSQFGRRSIGGIYTKGRIVDRGAANISQLQIHAGDTPSYGMVELDSHADTTCVGKNFRVISYTDRICQVSPYHPDYQAINKVPIVQAATAFDDPESGETYVLIFNECLYLGDALENTLMNPNQVRSNGIIVDDVPKHLSYDPKSATHSIYIPKEDLRIPLKLKGVISYFPSRYPSDKKIETCKWIELTSSQEWNPESTTFFDDEEQCERALESIEDPFPSRSIYSVESIATPASDIDDLIVASRRVNATIT